MNPLDELVLFHARQRELEQEASRHRVARNLVTHGQQRDTSRPSRPDRRRSLSRARVATSPQIAASTNERRFDATRVAIGAALLMLAYFTTINHVHLYPLNNLTDAGQQWSSTVAGWAQFGVFLVLMATRRPVAVFTSSVISLVWLTLQLMQWYVPYLFGSEAAWYLEGGYDETLRTLPSIAGHVVTPDLQHNALQLLSLGVVVATIAALVQARQRREAQLPPPAEVHPPMTEAATALAATPRSPRNGGAAPMHPEGRSLEAADPDGAGPLHRVDNSC